jgi:hypothetical protein
MHFVNLLQDKAPAVVYTLLVVMALSIILLILEFKGALPLPAIPYQRYALVWIIVSASIQLFSMIMNGNYECHEILIAPLVFSVLGILFLLWKRNAKPSRPGAGLLLIFLLFFAWIYHLRMDTARSDESSRIQLLSAKDLDFIHEYTPTVSSANSSAVQLPKISHILTIYSNETRFTEEDRCSQLKEIVWGNEAAEERAGWTRHWKWAIGIGAATAVAYKFYKNPANSYSLTIQQMKTAVLRFTQNAENNAMGSLR